MHRNIPFSIVAVVFTTACYKIGGYILIYGWSLLAGASSGIYSPLTFIIYSFLPQLLLNTIASVPLLLLIRFLGPVSFKKNSGDDEILDKQGDGTWLGI